MVKVLVVAQTPPPYGGAPIMVEYFVKSKMADVQLIHVRIAFASHIKEHGRIRASKLVHLVSLISRIIYHRFVNGARILYYLPAGPNRMPMFRDFSILLSTRWLFDKTVFHFQSGGVSDLYDRLPMSQRWLFRRAYFGADAAIRLSELTPEDGRRLEAKREYLIANAIDDPCPGYVVAPSRPAVVPNGSMRILFVGMLRESKGLMVLIEACGTLAARGVPFQLEIMGQWRSDEFTERVRQRIEDLNLRQHIRFLGVLIDDDKFAAYRRADVFCFPSFFNCEAFPVVLLEAMAHGLPVVSTSWRGIPEIVDDGETGYLVEPHAPDAVADRLALLADDAALRERMGRAGRVKFEREYTILPHLCRMRRVMLETAGVASDAEPQQISGAWQCHESLALKTGLRQNGSQRVAFQVERTGLRATGAIE